MSELLNSKTPELQKQILTWQTRIIIYITKYDQ